MIKRITSIMIILFLFKSCAKKEEKILPVLTSITESVYASATIQPDSLYSAFASVNGIVEKILVEEGDLVNKGTPIMQIINSNPKLVSENARLAYNLALKNYSGNADILSNIEKEIDAAQLTYKNDSVRFYRQKHLWDLKIGSKAEYDARELAYQLSGNNLLMLKNKYERTKNELSVQLDQAKNNYQNTLNTTEDFTVKSEINGKVYSLFKEKGEIVTTAAPVAAIGNAKDFVIELLIDEVDIVKIALEQDVYVSLDSYQNQIFKATISKIYPKKDERNQTFLVEAIFKDPPVKLFAGLAGEANIVVKRKENALTIPKDYLIEGNTVNTEKGLVRVEVGLQNMDTVEILSGISSSTWIYKPES
jgi:HlyD family secretion protein